MNSFIVVFTFVTNHNSGAVYVTSFNDVYLGKIFGGSGSLFGYSTSGKGTKFVVGARNDNRFGLSMCIFSILQKMDTQHEDLSHCDLLFVDAGAVYLYSISKCYEFYISNTTKQFSHHSMIIYSFIVWF
jgi:hypothetical protein